MYLIYYYNNNHFKQYIIYRVYKIMAEEVKTGSIANVGEVVNAIVADAKATNTVIAAVVGSIKKIAEAKVTEVKLNDVKHVGKMVGMYKDMLKNIIDALCSQDKTIDGKIQNLETLLDYKIDEEKSEPNKKVFKYGTINAALQIPKIIDSMFGIISKVADMSFGFKTMIKFKMNIGKLKRIIIDVFRELLNVFESIDIGAQWDTILKYIIKQPDTTLKFYTQVDNTDPSGRQYKQANLDREVFKGGSFGILDVFAKTFEIINSLNNLQAPNLIGLKVQILKMRFALKMLLSGLVNWGKNNINDDILVQLMYIEDAIIGSKNAKGQRDGGVSAIITALNEIFLTLDMTEIRLTKLLVVRRAITMLGWIINGTLKLLPILNNIGAESTIDVINNANEAFSGIAQLFKTVVIIGFLAIPFIPAVITSSIALLFLVGFIWAVYGVLKLIKNANLERGALDPIYDVIADMKKLMTDVLILGLIAIPAIVSMILAVLFVAALSLFCKAIEFVSKWVSTNALTTIKNIGEINVLLGTLMLVGLTILLFALIVPVIIKAITEYWLHFLAVLGIAILITWVVMKIAAKLSTGAAVSSIQLTINILIIMGSLMMAAAVILVAAAVGNILKDSDAIGTIVLTILGMIAIAAVMIGLGFALAAALPGIALAIAGISPMVVLLGMMVAAGLAMVALSKVDLDFGEYDKDKKIATGIKGNVGKILEFSNWLLTALGDKTKLFDSGRGKMRRGKRYMQQVNKTVKLIKNITYSIESISKITIDREKLLGDNGVIPKLFEIVEEINTKLFGDKGLMANDESANYGALDFIMPWKLISKSVNQKENKANRKLNRINKVISTLNNIGGSLMSIQKLNLDKGVRETIESKIGEMFTFITYLSGKISDFMKPTEDNKAANVSNRDIKKADKKLSKVESVMVSLNSITDTLKNIGEIKIGSITDKNSLAGKANDNIINVFGATNSLMTTVKSKIDNFKKTDKLVEFSEEISPVISCIKNLTSQFSDFADIDNAKLDKNINSFSGFVDKVNTIDIEKAQKTTQMFEQMSKFSASIKGDFDKLAEALNEKMLPVLEELKDIMEKVPEKLDSGFANTSASISAASAPATVENVTAQLNRENPDKDKNYIEKLLDKRMAEKAQQEANSTAAKLDELITLLKGFGPQPAVVKTL